MSDDEDKDFVLLPHYSGNPVGHNGEGLSCEQFCAIVESQIETFKWTDQDGNESCGISNCVVHFSMIRIQQRYEHLEIVNFFIRKKTECI